ncbi:tlp20 [Adoxophyes orana granulovirus]|uniref:Telokin-like protein 20 n=1 Tax=Adoxophyes orana granulovirus TaxID=170617 RepID=Q7T9S9_GVAO|nr:tlp20 [Adoxophyes orana granulovirus]AAP85723.1 tlp20 [Adoxophyes orana granulovirus]AJA91726.1 telokin-like protein 20 [Adoxophyes orana granulovirus]
MSKAFDKDNIINLYADESGAVFKSRKEYRLEKTGIPAYKFIVDKFYGGEITCPTNRYIVCVNANESNEPSVGLLITTSSPVVLQKDEIVFYANYQRTDDFTHNLESNTNNKTSLFDNYDVESGRKL